MNPSTAKIGPKFVLNVEVTADSVVWHSV